MEIRTMAHQEKTDRRALPLVFFSAQRKQQRFNPAPRQSTVHWIREDGDQHFVMFGVHGWMLSTYDCMSRRIIIAQTAMIATQIAIWHTP